MKKKSGFLGTIAAATLAVAGGLRLFGGGGISPKEYGIWLRMTGKDKQNKRKRKHYAKMCS